MSSVVCTCDALYGDSVFFLLTEDFEVEVGFIFFRVIFLADPDFFGMDAAFGLNADFLRSAATFFGF